MNDDEDRRRRPNSVSDEDEERRRRAAEIISLALDSRIMTLEDRSFLREISIATKAGHKTSWMARRRVRHLLGRVVFGAP